MCGISGIIKVSGEVVTKSELKAITDIIQHRGPDDEGFFIDGRLGFGHRRLAILDLSSDGHQPMLYLDRYVITYNGEIYNYIEIREQLQKAGYSFRSKTDTEIILAAYDHWGEECTHQFNGMWAFAIYDQVKRTVFCSRDRFGVKPFYYTHDPQGFVFGSEIKQFTALPDWKPVLNTERALDFLIHSLFDHTSETLFKGVNQLRGGHNLYFNVDDNTFKITKWYDVSNKPKQKQLDFEIAKKQLKHVFDDAVRLRLRSDVKVGSCLSGGIDSSAIVCTMRNLLANDGKAEMQETVSSCFIEKQFDEQEFIDEVIAKTGVKSNKVFPKFEDLFQKLNEIIWHQDEPFGSTSIFAQWNVFEEAKRNNLTVMLDGQGADESLAGYYNHQEAYHNMLFSQFKFRTLQRERNKLKELNQYKLPNVVKATLKKILPTYFKRYLRNRLPYLALKYIQPNIKELYQIYQPETFSTIFSSSVDQITTSHLPMLLHLEDRDSMAHSIESRVPFLDYRFVELVLSFPDKYKIHNGFTKYIFREAMTGVLPDKIKNRTDKMGFVTPEQLWIKNNSSYFRTCLKDAAVFFKYVVQGDLLLRDFDTAIKNNTLVIGSIYWRLIVLHQWVLTFKVKCYFN